MISRFGLKADAVLALFFFAGLCLSSSLTSANENEPATAYKKSLPALFSIDKAETTPGVAEVTKSDSGKAVIKTKKKFPWLLVGVSVVAVGAFIYFLLSKKKSPYRNGVLMINGVRYDMAAIPAGEFQMGSNTGTSYDQPVHTVRLSRNFWLGKTEVTQGLWQTVMGSNPSTFKGYATYPVIGVSWFDCQTFITKLNQLVGGSPFRFPTEAEWEYACKAGTTGDNYGNIDAIAWYYSNSGGYAHPVGQKQANAFGLYDMLGNTWEWCQDWYAEYNSAYQIDPVGPASGSYRINRGGAWTNSGWLVRASLHNRGIPDRREWVFGFRLASSSDGG